MLYFIRADIVMVFLHSKKSLTKINNFRKILALYHKTVILIVQRVADDLMNQSK